MIRLGIRSAFINIFGMRNFDPRGQVALQELPWLGKLLPLDMPFGGIDEAAVKYRRIDEDLVYGNNRDFGRRPMYLIGADDKIIDILPGDSDWKYVFERILHASNREKEVAYLFYFEGGSFHTWGKPTACKMPKFEFGNTQAEVAQAYLDLIQQKRREFRQRQWDAAETDRAHLKAEMAAA